MQTDTRLNGRHNRADFATHIEQQDGWRADGTRQTVTTPHRMAKDCQYTLDPLVSHKDRGCTGCKHKQPKEKNSEV